MTTIKIDKELVSRVKRILIEFGGPTIAMSALFEALGYQGLNGVLWGILLGVVSTIATELGYEVNKLGTIWTVRKPETKNTSTDTNQQKVGSDKKQERK